MKIQPIRSGERSSNSRAGKKLSSAASNVEQVRAKAGSVKNAGRLVQSRIEHGVDSETGETTLTAIFPRKEGRKPHQLDLSFLLDFPNLQEMFAAALLFWGSQLTPITRICGIESLRGHFFSYLNAAWSNMLCPKDIDDEVLIGFKENLQNKLGRFGKPLHPTTVAATLGDLRTILGSLKTGSFSSVANQIAERVPSGPAGAHYKIEPTAVFGLSQLSEIIAAAEKEILAIEDRFRDAKILLAEGYARLHDPTRVTKNARTDYNDFATCLAAVDEVYPGVIPRYSIIYASHPKLADAIRQIHKQNKIESHLYPLSRDLVPFVLLLAVATVFNPETILGLTWNDIEFNKDRAGVPAIEIVGLKGRASRDLVRLLDPNTSVSSRLSLNRMLDCLREITMRIRPFVEPEDRDCLFVYVTGRSKRRAKGFGVDGERRVVFRVGDLAWRAALKMFIEDNQLQSFTLNQFRPSILNLVQFIDGSLEAARKVGNHASPSTTWTHYTSGAIKARYRERIGQIVLLRERWVETCGTIDPRRLTILQDMGAATPGFSCLNPFDSPRPNQHSGKLCKDYGGCPSCPLAAAHPADPECVAFYEALELAIYRSQATMSAKTWIDRWAPVLADLSALRVWIHPDVLKASREISIQLPNVG